MKKIKRIENRELIEKLKGLPCSICDASPVDIDHVTTRGAGGNDIESNLLPLCRMHHTEKGTIGVTTFFEKYAWNILGHRMKYGLEPIARKKWQK